MTRRTALVAGAVGRMGEALLNGVLADTGYAEVHALVERPMRLAVARLTLSTLDALPAVDDVFVLVGHPDVPALRSYYGRDVAFREVDSTELPGLAAALAQRGARTLVMIQPTSSWQQIGAFSAGLASGEDHALASLPFASVTSLRPVGQMNSAQQRPWLERVVNVYLSVQLMVTPRSVPTLRSEQVARAAVLAARASQPGFAIWLAKDIERALA